MAANTVETAPSRPITADEYQRMGRAGIFRPDERVELLDGRIVQMPPIGHRHEYGVLTLNVTLQRMLGDRALVMSQGAFRLDALSEPQPDIAVLRTPLRRYATRLAAPDDILLVIEVADSRFDYDRGEKLRAYARGAIAEYWIVDIRHQRVLAFSDPDPEGERYRREIVIERGETIAPHAFPDAVIAIDDLLAPRA
jgi:Uma2 family endonuclease